MSSGHTSILRAADMDESLYTSYQGQGSRILLTSRILLQLANLAIMMYFVEKQKCTNFLQRPLFSKCQISLGNVFRLKLIEEHCLKEEL